MTRHRIPWWSSLLALVLSLVLVSASQAQLANTKIAFSSTRDGSREIYVMNVDGTNPIRLTNNHPVNDIEPAWSPDGTKIAFVTAGGIDVMNADGTGRTRLITNDPQPNDDPRWSPDGTQIVFLSARDGNTEIYKINVDGTGLTRLTNNAAIDAEPSWSPDGTKIAFYSSRDGGNYEIYVMQADGSGQTNLTNHPATPEDGPVWSPDGTKIVFRSNRNGNPEIYVMNADGTGQTRLTTNPANDIQPVWSPDGTKIAFTSTRDGNQEIYVMNADGTSPTRLTNNPASDLDPDWSPSFATPVFSPSTTSLNFGNVLVGTSSSLTFDIMNAGDKTLTITGLSDDSDHYDLPGAPGVPFDIAPGNSVTITVEFLPTRTGWAQGSITMTHNAAGSPSTVTLSGIGKVIPPAGPLAHTKVAFDSDRDENKEVYVMKADGTDQTRLTNHQAADGNPHAWSPDGTQIVFVSERDGNPEIYTMHANGTNQTRLTNDPAEDDDPSWSPDGSQIAFYSNRDGPYQLYKINVDGTGLTRLTNNQADDYEPSWSPDGTQIAFLSTRDGNFEIYTMNADGTDQTRLTHDPGDDDDPAWSPDGTQIAFSSTRDGNYEIYTMNVDGTGQTRLTNAPMNDQDPSWAPDGSQIAFWSARDGNREIYVMHADGSDQTNLTNTPANDALPAWSPFLPALQFAQAFAEPGGLASVGITLHHAGPVGGLQFRVTVVDEHGLPSPYAHLTGVLNNVPDFNILTNQQGDETLVLIVSVSGGVIPPGWTDLGELVYAIDEAAPRGAVLGVRILAGSSILSTPDGQPLGHVTFDGAIHLTRPGDPNQDGGVDVLDVIALINALLGRAPLPLLGSPEYFAMDVNSDGVIDILDVVRLINIVLGRATARPIAGPSSPVQVGLGVPQPGEAGQTLIPLRAQFDGAVAGVQLTLTYDPVVVTLGAPLPAASLAGMTVDSRADNGTLTLLIYSPDGQVLRATGLSTLLWLPVEVDDGGVGTLSLSQVVVANAQGQAVPVVVGTSTVKVAPLPTAFALRANRPNPFNPTTAIAYDVPQAAHITLIVYNLVGQEVARLVDEPKTPGRYVVTWDGRNGQGLAVASGVYLYRLTTSAGFSQTRRMTLLK